MSDRPPPKMTPPVEGFSAPRRRHISFGTYLLAIVGVLGIGAVLMVVMVLPFIARARRNRANNLCISNLSQISRGVSLYAADYDGAFPDPTRWVDTLHQWGIRRQVLHCPAIGTIFTPRYGYAFNKALAGKRISDVAGSDALVFDSSLLENNAASGLDTLPKNGRHADPGGRANHVINVDGSVRILIVKKLKKGP